jgi:hypothetical protein
VAGGGDVGELMQPLRRRARTNAELDEVGAGVGGSCTGMLSRHRERQTSTHCATMSVCTLPRLRKHVSWLCFV